MKKSFATNLAVRQRPLTEIKLCVRGEREVGWGFILGGVLQQNLLNK